uniref:uncharacterized protein K02A2.6-like n=1 Tax=Styela clava TaxID=7725 RepID=UPI00193AA2D5|nr:uncharacterized protein K02A2.6-like [Styela clava]
MYAIVFGCERFHDYLFGQVHITVQSDHKPLETILKKPLHCAPMRLQRMILRIHSYPLDVKYKAGKELFIADALSRAYDSSEYSSEKEEEIYDVNLLEYEDMKEDVYKTLVQETKNDSQMQSLYKIVQKGWSVKRSQVSQDVVEYWNYRDEITVCENLLLKGERIIIPTKLRPNILERVHIAHFGIEKTKSRARDSVFWPNIIWPNINADIEDYVSKCKTCLKHRRSNQKEPLIPHEIPNIPWSTVASDIFYYKGKNYLLVVDYFSKYPEIARLQNKTSYSVISAMKEIFARHGIPEKIVADNMPFNSSNSAEIGKYKL